MREASLVFAGDHEFSRPLTPALRTRRAALS